MRLSEIAQATKGRLLGPDLDITGVSIDSRSIKTGDTFVALKGPNFDGHDYVVSAEKRGASASVVQRELKESQLSQVLVSDTYAALTQMAVLARENFKGKVVAITGSCGKTTVKGMLRSICNLAGGCVATQGNLNNLIGVPLSLLQLKNEVAFGVFEAGTSVPGEIAALANIIQADVAVINNVMPVHVEGFGSLENIAREKTELFVRLKENSCAVINLDDAKAEYFVERSSQAKKIGFSRNIYSGSISEFEALVYAEDVQLNKPGAAVFTLCWTDEFRPCQLNVIGEHNVGNALAAAACATALGIGKEIIVKGLQAFSGDRRRMQIRRSLNGQIVIDDTYNANPGAVKAVIDYLKRFENSVLVLGNMGELGPEAALAHKETGNYARTAGVKALYATGVLAAEAASAFGAGAVWCESQAELIEKLSVIRDKNTVILIKGSRSAQMENIVEALCHPEGER